MTKSRVFNFEKRTHGIRATYSDGCRCNPCKEAAKTWARKNEYDPCPTCGELKYKKSRECGSCGRNPAGLINPAGPIRAVDVKAAGSPALRPPHYPPACDACNGFGYTPHTWSRCRTCLSHPGHQMSHEDWSLIRA